MKLINTIFLFFICLMLNAQTINVEDFGVKPNTFEDMTEGVKDAIAASKKHPGSTLVFPKGRYDFWPEKAEKREYFISNTSSEWECPSKIKNVGLLFEGMDNITLEGNGALFVFHGKMITIALHESSNIKIQNLSIDFERPSMSEFRIDELYSDKLIATIHPDSKYTIMDNRIHFYGEGWGMNDHFFCIETDTLEGTNKYSNWDPIKDAQAVEIAPQKVIFHADFSNTNYTVGKTLTIRSHIRDHVGVFVNRSKNITLENVNLHYMHGLGIISQFSENMTYRKINITPSRGRTIAAFADGMHFSGCKGHIEVEGCNFKGLHDDPINVHGTYLKIVKTIDPKKLIVHFIHPQTYGMKPFFEGDTIAFIEAKTLSKVDFAQVKCAELISEREVELELDKALPLGITDGDCIENLTCTPSLRVSGCRMEMTNTRGLLVTTPRKVIIENNYFYRTGMYAILIAADANSWYESGAVTDVIIRNNIFDGCAYNFNRDNNNYAIAIEPENHERKLKHCVHRNVQITDNIFKVFDNKLLLKARSTQGILFSGNRVEKTEFLKEASTSGNRSFKFDDCNNVRIEKNIFNLNDIPIEVECVNMKPKDIKVEKKVSLLLTQ